MPRKGSRLQARLDEFKTLVIQGKKFSGDSLGLLQAVYKGEYQATHDQLYAAAQVLRFEHSPAAAVDGRSIEEIREEVRKEIEGDPEKNKVKLHEIVAEFVRYAVRETVRRLNGHPKYPTPHPAWVCDEVDEIVCQLADAIDFSIGGAVDKALAEPDVAHATELTSPQPPMPAIRKRTPVEIDGTADGSDAGIPSEARESAAERRKDVPPSPPAKHVPDRDRVASEPAPQPSRWDNPSLMSSPPPGDDLIEVHQVTRRGVITKYLPRRNGSGYE